jgi:hypothetical protein
MLTALVLKNRTIADVVTTSGDSLDLNSITGRGSVYKLASRELAFPFQCEFDLQVGQPQQLGNDKLTVKISQAATDTETGRPVVGSIRCEISVPRSSFWSTEATEDLMGNLVSVIGLAANRAKLAAGLVP